MKPLDQPADLRKYYQDRSVVSTYMQRRTGQPLNGVLHRRQIKFLNHAVAERSLRTVLEIACGPGRLTAAMRGVRLGIAIDASPAMLEEARQRLNGGPASWWFLRSDAFVLPFRSETFDAVYTLRFVRHFQSEHRQRLYTEIRRVLRPGGVFMVDALNRNASLPFRLKRGVERYEIFDVLYRCGEFEAELQAAGFRVAAVEAHLKHVAIQRSLNRLRRVRLDGLARVLIRSLEHLPGGNPSGWMLLCEKQA